MCELAEHVSRARDLNLQKLSTVCVSPHLHAQPNSPAHSHTDNEIAPTAPLHQAEMTACPCQCRHKLSCCEMQMKAKSGSRSNTVPSGGQPARCNDKQQPSSAGGESDRSRVDRDCMVAIVSSGSRDLIYRVVKMVVSARRCDSAARPLGHRGLCLGAHLSSTPCHRRQANLTLHTLRACPRVTKVVEVKMDYDLRYLLSFNKVNGKSANAKLPQVSKGPRRRDF